ncbi:MAG: restriction endonuclease [Methylophaga sp.]|nr:restriction endonuclease [Methylophaga sp.]
MARKRKNKNGDLYVGIATLVAISFILDPEGSKNFIISFLQILTVIFVVVVGFMYLYKKKNTKSIPISTDATSSPDIWREPKGSVLTPPPLESLLQKEKLIGSETLPSIKTSKQEWSVELIKELEWKRFEELCSGYFSAKGYKAELSRQGADGGIDIYLHKESYSATKVFGVVQCKAWGSYKVGVKPIRELFGVMTSEKAPLAIFITSGSYTKEAKEFAKGKSLKLLTGDSLIRLIKSLPEVKSDELLKKVISGDYTTPSCPSCDIKMIKRMSKKGQNKGKEFWGCNNYPRCRNTLKFK